MNKRVKEFLDKSSNYEVIEYIGQLQQENKQLKEELEYTIRIVEHNRIINEKNKEIHQLKDNWNKLKEYIDIKLYNTEYLQKICNCRIDDTNHILLDAIRERMLELEKGSVSNE